MTTPAEPQVNSATPEIVAPDAPDRGAQDDAYFQSFIDNAVEEDDDVIEETSEESTETVEAPTAEAVAPPSELPPTEPAPQETPAPTVPNETEVLRQQVQQYEQRLQAQVLEAQRLQIEQETQQHADRLQQQGLMPEQAAQIANEQRELRQQVLDANQRAGQIQEFMDAKQRAVAHFATQYGVSQEALLQYNDQGSMETAARSMSQIGRLEAEVAALKRGAVPAQTMDTNQPAGASGGSEIRLVDSALNKTPNERTQAENDAMRRMAGM
jgi:DNA repair exonuclease SbcCD ATPase subunit